MYGVKLLLRAGKPSREFWLSLHQNTGAFQNLGVQDVLPSPGAKAAPHFYADTAVIAYRRAASDVSVESLHPNMTASSGAPDSSVLTDGECGRLG